MGGERPARLGVRVLGPFALDGADLLGLRSRKARQVLARLAVAEGTPVGTDALAEAVWGDSPPADPVRDLAVLVSRGRSLLGADRLPRQTGGYVLLADWWDRIECEALVRAAASRRDSGDLVGARTAVRAALSLVRGQFLAGDDSAWAGSARARVETLVAEARQIAAETALAAGQLGEAAASARAAIDHDPYDEVAVRILMRVQASSGRPASALATYAEVAGRLADELGVDPAAETRALHERILRSEPIDPLPRSRAGAPGPTGSAGPFGPTGPPDSGPSVDGTRGGQQTATGLVGRDRQLARLDAALNESRGGVRVVVVVGEPGAGKSALLEHWSAAARRRGAIVLAGRAEDHDLALQPVLDALAGRLGSSTGQPAGPDGSDGPDGPDHAEPRRLPGPGASAAALQRQSFDELSARLAGIVADDGLALVIDDLQSADTQTLAWLGHLLRRPASHRLLVIGASADPGLVLPADTERLPLPPLEPDDVRLLVGDDRADEVYARSGGNALLVTELARSTDELPATIRAAVAARLAGTGDAAATLRTAAVIGPRIDLDLLAGIVETSPLTVLDQLDEGVRRGFLIEHESALQFRHELVRAAVAADTGATRRDWVHRRAAALLATRPDVGAAPLELVRHARLGGDPETLVAGLALAAEVARDRLDLAGAEALLGEALAVADRPELRLRRARIRMARGDLDGADADAQAAMAADDTGEALEQRAWAARNRHDMDAAIRLGTAGAAAATDPATRASCLVAVAFAHRGRGDLRTTDDLLTEASALDPPTTLRLPAWTGALRVHQGRPAEALASLEPLLGADSDRGLPGYWVEHTLQMTAHAYGLIGRPADALAVVDRWETEIERRGTTVRYAGGPDTYRSWILRNLGAPGATDLARVGLERAGSVEIGAQCHLDLADGLLRDGEFDSAAAHLDEADRGAAARWFHNRWRFDQRSQVLQARLRLAAGEPAEALEPADRVRAGAADRGDRRYLAIGSVLLATALARSGQSYDVAEVREQLTLLPDVAALESWWLIADLAAATGVPQIAALAERSVERLCREAPEQAGYLRAAASARLA